MPSEVKNISFSLPADLIDRLNKYAENNDIASMDAGVKKALEEYLNKLEKVKLHKEMSKAVKSHVKERRKHD